MNTAKLAAPRPPLRLGVWAAGTPTSYRGPNGAWAGYEARVVGAFAATNQQAFNLTWLGSLDERLEALEGGEVDVVVGGELAAGGAASRGGAACGRSALVLALQPEAGRTRPAVPAALPAAPQPSR